MLDDAPFILYRSTNPYAKNNQWIAIAFDIPQLRQFAYDICKEKSKACKELSFAIESQIDRLEVADSVSTFRSLQIGTTLMLRTTET